jgi:uncharacterized protein (TIGR02647 family)
MTLSVDAMHEIRILSLFNPKTALEGIKVHHDACSDDVAATQRLFDKGLITLYDGGYLTALGQEAVRKLDDLVLILSSDYATEQAKSAAN